MRVEADPHDAAFSWSWKDGELYFRRQCVRSIGVRTSFPGPWSRYMPELPVDAAMFPQTPERIAVWTALALNPV